MKYLHSEVTPRPIYLLPDDPFTTEVLIPGFRVADSVDTMVGFFSSSVLASLAPGLATFINESSGTFRLIVSPLLQPKDIEAIRTSLSAPDDLVSEVLDELLITEDYIATHTLTCFAWLLKTGRLEMRVALMMDSLFHPKVWLFHRKNNTLAAHGSSNLTVAGIHRNIEQVAISTSWGSSSQEYVTRRLSEQFIALWDNALDGCIVLPLPEAVRNNLLGSYKTDTPPSETDLQALYQRARERTTLTHQVPPVPISFSIPGNLVYRSGPFAHQGEAVDAWINADYHGILEMATGSGKTITSLIAATKLYERYKPLLIVVTAPYIPLIQQWCDEIRLFGIDPLNLSEVSGPRARAKHMGRLRRLMRSNVIDIAIIVVSHRLLASVRFRSELEKFNCHKLVIADEAHNLGSKGFQENPPTVFDSHLGLSATPIRQGDDEGTRGLVEFLGPIVFRYSLEQAVGTCLVSYDYFVHPVSLTDTEMESWYDLCLKIRANSWRRDSRDQPDEYLKRLQRERRVVLELAANKLLRLTELLDAINRDDLRYTLVYTSDKGPSQLQRVNEILTDRHLLFHQLTYEETSDRRRTRQILSAFQDGSLQILTAKRVLDEGVNIPQIQTAYILASTTVERQWVQRRGRILRKCKAIGKTHSVLHDFVVLPSTLEDVDKDGRRLVQSELERVQQFARLARNAGRPDGPLAAMTIMEDIAYS